MAASVFEEALALRIGILEALPATEASYPLPALAATGRVEQREFLAVVLENPYLRVTIVPSLGGRILRVFDKRTSLDVLPVREVLVPVEGSSRGVRLPDGLQLRLNGEDRPNSLGHVAHQLDDPVDEEDEAAVWLAECASGFSWHLRVALPQDRAEIRVEGRVLNRGLEPLTYNAELVWEGGAFGVESRQLVALDTLRRFESAKELGARQVDTWSVTLAPYSFSDAAALSVHSAIQLGPVLSIQAARTLPGCKVLLLTDDDRTLEAGVDLYPESVAELDLGGIQPKAVVLQSATGEELVRYPVVRQEIDPELRELAFEAGKRHVAYLRLGIDALRRRDFQEADWQFETALLYNGDDPLLWWIKAVTQRLLGNVEERAELQNAHYLAPLEPTLRAEAFLSQSAEQGREANPLLNPLLPDELIEVACLLIEHGLPDQASRWIDEALRHADLAMLRYLMADILLEGTRMETEAAQHVMLGGRAQVPPYPWRAAERAALVRLAARFPSDERLSTLLREMG